MYRSTTCVWKFNTEADLRIVLGVTDITKDATDTITLRDSNGMNLKHLLRKCIINSVVSG